MLYSVAPRAGVRARGVLPAAIRGGGAARPNSHAPRETFNPKGLPHPLRSGLRFGSSRRDVSSRVIFGPGTQVKEEEAGDKDDAATEEEQRLALAAAGPPDGKWGALPTLKEDGNGRILSSVLKFINVSTWKKVQKATRTKYLMAINGETSITDEKFFKAAVEFGDIPIDKQSHGKPDVLGSHWGKTGHARPINIYETALLMIFHEEDSEIVPPKLVYKTYCKLKASPVLELGAAGDDLNKWNIKVEEQIEWLDGL